jgi:hypothetical protein
METFYWVPSGNYSELPPFANDPNWEIRKCPYNISEFRAPRNAKS